MIPRYDGFTVFRVAVNYFSIGRISDQDLLLSDDCLSVAPSAGRVDHVRHRVPVPV